MGGKPMRCRATNVYNFPNQRVSIKGGYNLAVSMLRKYKTHVCFDLHITSNSF